MKRIKVKLTNEEKRLLDDGVKSLNKKINQLTFLDVSYLMGFTKLSLEKIYNYCIGNYTLSIVEEIELI